MHLMADAVARSGVIQAVLGGHVLQVDVVIGVPEIPLQHVVIHITHGQLRPHARYASGFKLQIGQGAQGILRQGLIDAQGDLLARLQRTTDEMGLDEFMRQVHRPTVLNQGLPSMARCGTNIQPSMMRRAVRCVVTLSTSQSAPCRYTFAPTSMTPAGWPRRSRSVVAAHDTSCTTVPSTAAATAVHIDDVAGNVRCVFSIEMARATRSMCSTVMLLPLLL